MAEQKAVKELVKALSQSKIVLSGDVTDDVLEGIDISLLASKLEEGSDGSTLRIVSAITIKATIDELKAVKMPLPMEVLRSSDFNPIAAEYDASYAINSKASERAEGTTNDFVVYFRDRLRRIKGIIEEHRKDAFGLLQSIENMKGFADGREMSIVGIVTSKMTTRNGNLMVIIEDDTAEARVIFTNGTSSFAKALFGKATNLVNDEVIAVKGKKAGALLIANEILLPDVPIKNRKEIKEDLAIGFMSDVHVGSKMFLEKNFNRVIQWLNGETFEGKYKDLAGKIKYIMIAGDVADGIGIYPDQQDNLAILDIYLQYKKLFEILENIPDYIHVFMIPGNHDAVQRAEPQPPLGLDIIKDFKRDNIHIMSNPSYVTLNGIDILSYHGTSLDSMIASIPGLSYAQPEKAMIEVLKRRHLSPIYGGNIIVPSKNDNLVIDKVPDILHMGHIHKNGISNYHGVDIINSGTWQSRTDYQIRQGHIPSPCILPVYEMRTRNIVSMDFSSEAQ